MAVTQTIRSVVNFASTHVELMPIADVGGYSNEPAISLANDTVQELCSQPHAWEFNQKNSNLLCTQVGLQEQPFAGASAFTSAYGASIGLATDNAISESGNTVTVNTLHAHNMSVGETVYMTGNTVAAYNSTFTSLPTGSAWSGGWTITAVPSTTTFQFTHATAGLANSGAPGITDFAWLESATMISVFDTAAVPFVWEVQAVRSLKRSSQEGRPRKVAITREAAGVITVRYEYVPTSGVWGLTLTYQAKPPLKTTLSDTWSPFPDEFGFVYRQAFLARCYRYLNHPRADAEEQRAQMAIAKALRADDREDIDQYITPVTTIMDGYYG